MLFIIFPFAVIRAYNTQSLETQAPVGPGIAGTYTEKRFRRFYGKNWQLAANTGNWLPVHVP